MITLLLTIQLLASDGAPATKCMWHHRYWHPAQEKSETKKQNANNK